MHTPTIQLRLAEYVNFEEAVGVLFYGGKVGGGIDR